MCMYDANDCRPEWYRESHPKARKPHKCEECRRDIHPGEVYQNVAGKWEGDVSEHKMCRHCRRAADLLVQECDGYVLGGVKEDLQEHVGEREYSWGRAAARLLVGMDRKWMRFDGKGLMDLPVIRYATEQGTVAIPAE